MLAAFGMVIPYWIGGHTWGIRYGRIWLIIAVVLSLPAWAVYHRRFGSDDDIKRRLTTLRTREKILCALILIVGLVPSVVLIVAVAADAGLA